MTKTNRHAAEARVLPEIFEHAKQAEDLLRDPKTLGSVRCQLEEAMVDAAKEMGIDIFHPAIVRQVFIEIFRESGRRFKAGIVGTTHHFESAAIRLLTVVNHGANDLGPVSVEEEDRLSREISEHYFNKADGLEEHSRAALQDFVIRARLREVRKQLEADAA